MTVDTKIIKGAEGLFLRYGIKSVTMDDVASRLGISKKTLYQVVENKSDLIHKVIQHRHHSVDAFDEIANTLTVATVIDNHFVDS